MKSAEKKLIKNIAMLLSVEILSLLVGVINSFLVPGFLSVYEYGLYKTFFLYTSLVGFLHFGFMDGIYIKYGGYSLKELDRELLSAEISFALFFQLIIMIVFVSISLILRNVILILTAFVILPINLQTFIYFIYQATGELKAVGLRKGLYSILNLTANVVIVFLLKNNSYKPFVISKILIDYFFFFSFFALIRRNTEIRLLSIYKTIDIIGTELKALFNSGFLVMLGNFSSILFYSIDQWFVKIFFGTQEFAFYSFAITIMNVLNILISSSSTSIYSYLSVKKETQVVKLIKLVLLTSSFLCSVCAYFVFRTIVIHFLPRYAPSLEFVKIFLMGFPAMVTINVLYVNIYKTRKMERKYFLTVVSMLLFSFFSNILAYKIFRTTRAISFSTVGTYYLWLFYSLRDFSELRFSFKEIVALVLYLSSFVISFFLPILFQGIIFFLSSLAIIVIFSKELKRFLQESVKIFNPKNLKIF